MEILGEKRGNLIYKYTENCYPTKVEAALAAAAERQAQGAASALERVEEVVTRLAECERQGAAAGALRESQAALASEVAARSGMMLERLKLAEERQSSDKARAEATLERLGALEKAVGQSSEPMLERLGLLEKALDRSHGEVESLRAAQAQQDSALRKHAQDVEARFAGAEKAAVATGAEVDQVRSRLLACERAMPSDSGRSFAGLSGERKVLDAQLGALERTLRDSADCQAESLAAARAKLDQMQGRLSACERNSGPLCDLQRTVANLAKDRQALSMQCASLREHVERLEKAQHDLIQEHARDFQDLRAAHSRLSMEAKAQQGASDDAVLQERDKVLAAAQERLSQLEAAARDSSASLERCTKALDTQRALQAKLASDAHEHGARYASVVERLAHIERAAADSAESCAKELVSAHDKLDRLQDCLSEERSAHQQHSGSIEGLQREHAALLGRCAALEEDRVSLGRQLDKAQRALGSAADRPSHAAIAECAERFERQLRERSERHRQDLDGMQEAHARLAESLRESVEQQTRSWTSTRAELDRLKGQVHEDLAYVGEELGRFGGRLMELEASERAPGSAEPLQDAAPLQAIAGAQAKLDQLHRILREDQAALEDHLAEAVGELKWLCMSLFSGKKAVHEVISKQTSRT